MPHLSPILWLFVYFFVAFVFLLVLLSLEFFCISLKR